MRIFISTGIYPPEVGGPAEYAFNLEKEWKNNGHKVSIGVFSTWNFLPTGLRHLAYLISIIPNIFFADYVFILDTFSAALPTVILGKFLGKKMVLRTGGDFLWESYVERTGDLVLLRDFYQKSQNNFSSKEKKIFNLIKYILKNVSVIVWSTKWQQDIFTAPYGLKNVKSVIIENYFGQKIAAGTYSKKNFIAGGRKLKWKNIQMVSEVFNNEEIKAEGILDLTTAPHDKFLEKIRNSYAVIVASLGDISPNTIIDAITSSVPFIVTKETGLYERIKDVAIFVDPKNKEDIYEKVLWLLNSDNYEIQKKKLAEWNFIHDWKTIASEYENIFQNIK
jgi:glycosyltransferase involved in cell wall biosynthesis